MNRDDFLARLCQLFRLMRKRNKMDVSQIERARTKAFYKLLVDRLGADSWTTRRASLVERIRTKESKIDLKMPIESQLFVPLEDDIDWYGGITHWEQDKANKSN